uniref:Cilia- and flagella-associated protein 263 n=1 Tax=Lotharella globosa TaxID=91324 RepID=A0A7S3YGK6_9EUKA
MSVTKDDFARYVWENEMLLRENAMLEAYLAREKEISAREGPTEPPPSTSHKSKRPGSRAQRRRAGSTTLTLEKKIFIAEKEIKAQNVHLAEIEEEYQSESINYKAMTGETEVRITEIKREAYEFKRSVLSKGFIWSKGGPATRKVPADAVIKYYDSKIKSKDMLVTKLQARNKVIAAQVAKMESQLNNKNHSEETLSPIDFRQLMIENESFSQTIDAKNKDLLKIKVSTTKMGQMLTDKRQLLVGLQDEAVSLRKRIAYQEAREKKLRDVSENLEYPESVG